MAGTYESLFCSKMNAASVVVTSEVVGTLNHYKMVKKNLNFVHLKVVISSSLVLVLELALALELELELVLEPALELELELVLGVVGT